MPDLTEDPIVWDDVSDAWLIGETDTHLVHVVPMLYNHRVVLTPKRQRLIYVGGWCYPDLLSATAAARVWDPDTEERPVGFIKEALPREDWNTQ